MEEIKDIISSKDLNYISDIFNWNYTALKEVNHFINEVESEEIKEILEEVFNMHYENCTKCISILENEHEEVFMEGEEYENE